MEELALLRRAQHAISSAAPENVAERIILFPVLLHLLEEVLVLKHKTADQRRCLRESTYDFIYTMKQLRDAIEDWNLGLHLTKELLSNLDRLERCIDDLQLILLAEGDGASAMIATDDPTVGQEL